MLINGISTHTHVHHYDHEAEKKKAEAVKSPTTACATVGVYIRQLRSDTPIPIERKVFTEHVEAVLAQVPVDELTKKVRASVDNGYEQRIFLETKNLTFPGRVALCDKILRDRAALYREEYGIDIVVEGLIDTNNPAEEILKFLSKVTENLEVGKYRGVLILSVDKKFSVPFIFYKRNDQTYECMAIKRTFSLTSVSGTLVSYPFEFSIFQKIAQAQFPMTTKIFAECNSTPYLSADDACGNLIVLSNALLSMRLDKYKDQNGLLEVLQAGEADFKSMMGGAYFPKLVPPEWTATDEIFDATNGRDLCVVPTEFFSREYSVTNASLHEFFHGNDAKVRMPKELIRIISSYVIDPTIGGIRALFTQPVRYKHTIYLGAVAPDRARTAEETLQVCVYNTKKAYEIAGLPLPVEKE